MDAQALQLSLSLAACTVLILAPLGVFAGRALARAQFRGKALVEALLALPLVLPPTVIGYYLLVGVGGGSLAGRAWERLTGHGLVFHFEGLVVASLIVNIPFVVQPIQRAFAAIPADLREAGACAGLSPLALLWRLELPLAWPGIVLGLTLAFAHTLGEFGVVLMVGGSIPGETKTLAVSLYDRVEAFDLAGAQAMAVQLSALAAAALALAYALSARVGRTDG